MYTTPRKVKQESRLRRSLSLTNTTGLGPTTRPNGCSTEGDLVDLGDNCEDLLLNCNSLPPPYRLPPPASNTTEFSPENSNQIYQTHSSKFPIIRETTYADPGSNSVKFGPVTTEFYTKIQPKSVKQAWADGRNKSFTLERPSARERLISQQEALVRRSSLDLERFLQVFNEDRPLMASMQQQQGHLNGSLGGIDNPGLDLGQVYSINGQKMASYYPESTSTTSLSLSSSNTDSVDTVIYKTGISPSIRDWQRFSEANANQTSDFNHRTTENNSYRDSNLFDSRTYQIQQQQLQQQQQQQFNSSNYTIEYRNAQIQQQILQNQNQNQVNLSGVQSTGQNSTCNNNHNNNGISTTTSSNINNNGISLRNPQTQQPGAGYTGLGMGNTGSSTTTTSNTIGSSKSPMLPMKFSTPSSSNTPGLTLEAQQVQDKNSKESSKIFQTKYNHIKDMISSRFGNSQQQHQQHQQPNNKVIQNPSEVSRNLNNSSATATTTVQQQVNGQFDYNGNHQGQNYGNQNGVGYYSRPATGNTNSSGTSPGHHNGLGYANKSPLLSDNKKSINTSFRKAIQKSTQKSNLVEDSLQMRSIPDIQQQQQQQQQHQQQLNYRQVQFTQQDHQMIKQQQLKQQQQQQYQLQQNEQQMQHAERAQRALDKLCELQGVPGQGTQQQGQGQGQFNRVGSLGQPGNYMRNQGGFAYPDVQMGYTNGQLGPEKIQQQQQQQMSYNGGERHRFSVKPNGPSPSSISLNSSQMNGPSSILHQPVFKPSMKLISPHDNEAFDTVGNDPPPPLPTSQKPSIHNNSGSQNIVHHDEIGLPILSLIEKRENGDGSTGSTESGGGKNIIEAGVGSSGGKLKQITENMQNLALSVSASGNIGGECHLSSSSECEKSCQRVGSGQSHTTTDSGHGTAPMTTKSPQNSDPSNSDPLESMAKMRQFGDHIGDSISSGNDSENWVDIEPEIRQILEMERIGKSSSKGGNVRNSSGILHMHPPSDVQQQQQNMLQNEKSAEMNEMTISQSILHPPQSSSGGKQQHNTSPNTSPKLTKKYDLNSYNKKPSQELAGCSRDQPVPSTSGNNPNSKSGKQQQQLGQQSRPSILRSNSGSGGQQQQQQQQGQGQQQLSQQQQRLWSSRQRITEGLKSKSSSKNPLKSGKLSRNAMSQILYSLQDDMNGDMTSTTTGLDLESMLDQTECTSDDDDLSTTIDTTDAHAIRRQLESLESMYTEVLKVLGAKKFQGNRFPNSTDLRSLKRRPYGSMSSLPSSVSSRPFRDKKIGKLDDKKKVKDLKSINRRFQRLESHVVTLARSVAHLSSEMRTQHLMVQEMDSIRNELSQLKSQIMKSTLQFQSQNQSGSNQNQNSSTRMSKNGVTFAHGTDWTTFRNALPSLTNPCRVRKLTKFFGDEPPLVRIFLKKLGYEKYATAFELERIGIMELPYLTEERLSKMGIPMGPRLRILQEAQVCLKPGGYIGSHQDSHHNTNHTSGNLSVYVV